MLAKAAGATPIVLVDVTKLRLDFAFQYLGANPDHLVQVDKKDSVAEVCSTVLHAFREIRPRIIFECTGFEVPIQASAEILDSGGYLVQVGIGLPVKELSFSSLLHRQIDIRFVMRSNSCFEDCIRLIEDDIIDPLP